jgi:hypothetical protein
LFFCVQFDWLTSGILGGRLGVMPLRTRTACPQNAETGRPPLTDAQIKNAKPKAASYKLSDGGGLYLEVMPIGAKLWRLKFKRLNGKESRLALGRYSSFDSRLFR